MDTSNGIEPSLRKQMATDKSAGLAHFVGHGGRRRARLYFVGHAWWHWARTFPRLVAGSVFAHFDRWAR